MTKQMACLMDVASEVLVQAFVATVGVLGVERHFLSKKVYETFPVLLEQAPLSEKRVDAPALK